MRRRNHLAIALALVTLFGAGQALWRSRPAPKPIEIIDWEPYSTLGEAPWESMVLVDFTADWCAACRRMQVTTFRDPAFKSYLEAQNFRPVRVEDAPGTREQFSAAVERYGVDGFPTLLLLDENGMEVGRVVGVQSTGEIEWNLEQDVYRTTRLINWTDARSLEQPGDKVPVLLLKNWNYLDTASKHRWLWKPAPEFAQWANRYLVPAIPRYRRHGDGVADYRKHGITQAPTLLVFGRDGEEIARFEGQLEVEKAPAELARIARKHGYEITDPPPPRGE